jgi:hypothetical protein
LGFGGFVLFVWERYTFFLFLFFSFFFFQRLCGDEWMGGCTDVLECIASSGAA